MKRFFSDETTVPEVIKFMKRLAACSVCEEVPRGDVTMLLCRNGHNVCATCKSRLDAAGNSKCPAQQCDFDDPPRTNATVADIVERLPLACKYSKVAWADRERYSSCPFEDDDEYELEDHEAKCERRHVPCPNSCSESVSANRVVYHLVNKHKAVAETKGVDEDIDSVKKHFYSGFVGQNGGICPPKVAPYNVKPQETSFGWALAGAEMRHRRTKAYVWLQLVANSSVTEKLRCKITLRMEGDSATGRFLSFDGPVYPIDWSREKILKDAGCTVIGAELLNEHFSDTCHFDLTFEIVKKRNA